MDTKTKIFQFFLIIIIWCSLTNCNNHGNAGKELVSNPDKMDQVVTEKIKAILHLASSNNGKVDDSLQFQFTEVLNQFYAKQDYHPIWSSTEKWMPLTDSLFNLMQHLELEGLFPDDYQVKSITALHRVLMTDSSKKMDASIWSRAELLLTDGFIHVIKDLKRGRLEKDSLTLAKDTLLTTDYYSTALDQLFQSKNFTGFIRSLQPVHKGYWELKQGIPAFLDSMDTRTYPYITYPYKKGNSTDSLAFVKLLQQRLYDNGYMAFAEPMPDTAQLSNAIQQYQKRKGIKPDGKISTALIKLMNSSDIEKFKRIAITLDRYKMLPEKMPEKYIWVNLPGYYLWVIQGDTIALESKVICGKPETRTPLLHSMITDMVTYPTWTVPTSIISKQYLPKLKNNPNYLTKIGLKIINGKGEVVDPTTINWSKYSRGIPFSVMQGSGDNNALGVMKFNFNNPYSVYLHDTNQRYLFKNSFRALSHGCVRVQDWEKLAFFIAKNDSIHTTHLRYNTDSIRNWIAAKEKHRIDVQNKIPLFIQYFSCEGQNGKIRFYDDIYGEDKIIRDKYFKDKKL